MLLPEGSNIQVELRTDRMELSKKEGYFRDRKEHIQMP